MAPAAEMRLDELARRAGVATTTVRLYQNRGLLPGPRLAGRTGFYDQRHLTRLALIGRLQDQGFSLAGIGRLLDTWEDGRDLDDLVGVEHELDVLLTRHETVLDAAELAARFPSAARSPELIRRASSMGLIEATTDGRFRIPDQRFLEAGATLIGLGVPAEAVLDEWAALAAASDGIAERFLALFERHLLPEDWRRDLTGPKAAELAATLGRLRQTARQILLAALDASITRAGTDRLGALVAPAPDTATAPDTHTGRATKAGKAAEVGAEKAGR